MIKPIMSQDVEERVENYLQQYSRRDQWKAWGLDKLREQGGALLMYGPPGCGKTTIARWAAHRIGKGMKELDVSKLPSNEGGPGEYERAVHNFFDDAASRNWMLIFMDECDHLLISRDQIGEAGKTWQLGGVEQLMMRMNTYKGPIIAATNHMQFIDPALDDRFLDIIKIDDPDFNMRIRLWRQKIPKSFPLQLSDVQVKQLAKHPLNGRRIEIAIINAALHAMRQRTRPTFALMEKFATRALKRHIK